MEQTIRVVSDYITAGNCSPTLFLLLTTFRWLSSFLKMLRTDLYPQIPSLLEEAKEQPHVAVIVITCGLKAVWEAVLSRSGLHTVLVLGNNRIWDGVFDSETKAMVVKYLQETHSCYVTAFGDSPLDIPMLRVADDALVVVGDETTRSRSMDDALLAAMIVGALPRSTRQAVFDSATPRLRAPLPPSTPDATPGSALTNTDEVLPVVNIIAPTFLKRAFHSRSLVSQGFQFYDATDKSASKLLTTPTRNKDLGAVQLRRAHHEVGRYLALEYISDIIGLAETPIPHVQGGTTTGHAINNESNILIIALMRGGEPMALGSVR